MARGRFETWIDEPGRDVRAISLSRPWTFESPFGGEPFVLLLVVCDPNVTSDERVSVSDQIVRSGCRYVCAAGHECSQWDTSVDMSYIESHPGLDPPPETFIMTSWHEREPISETVDFALECTNFDAHEFTRYLVAFLGEDTPSRAEFESAMRTKRRGGYPPTK